MAPSYKDKDGGVVLTFNGQWVSWSHTIVAYSMFVVRMNCSAAHCCCCRIVPLSLILVSSSSC